MKHTQSSTIQVLFLPSFKTYLSKWELEKARFLDRSIPWQSHKYRNFETFKQSSKDFTDWNHTKRLNFKNFNTYIAQNSLCIWSNALYNQIKSNQIKCQFLRRGENRSTRRKTSRSRVENQQTQPTYDAESGNRTRATLVEGECSTTAPTLLPVWKQKRLTTCQHFRLYFYFIIIF